MLSTRERAREREKEEKSSSLGEFIPIECAFNSSAVLIVNHVTKKKAGPDDFGLALLLGQRTNHVSPVNAPSVLSAV